MSRPRSCGLPALPAAPVFVEGAGGDGSSAASPPARTEGPPPPSPPPEGERSGNGAPGTDGRGPLDARAEARSRDPVSPPLRRELRNRLRRMWPLEGAALLGGEALDEMLHLLEVQEGFLSLLDDVVADDPEDRELVREAREAGERVRGRLLLFLRTLKDGIPDRRPLDVSDFIAGISGRLARLVGEEVRLRLAPASRVLRIEGNAELLERAITHLVANARAASAPGDTIRVSWGRAAEEEVPKPGAELVRIVVQDQGTGISRELLPWAFEPFFSSWGGEGPEGGRTANRGMGLPVVQAIVEGHGGWVDIRSAPGRGTEVVLFLPLARPMVDSDPAERETGVRGRILLVEDEPLLGRLLQRTLSRHALQVDRAEVPEEAERLWSRIGDDVDLVIVERLLPGHRKGEDLAAALRRSRPDLPVLLLDRRAGEGSGSVRVVTESGEELPVLNRPFVPGDVLGAVRRILARAPATRQSAAEDEDPGPPSGTGGGPGGGVPPGDRGGIVLH